jgi:mannose-6-phosphate isomerase-like protein (cupin superfamily)
VWFTDGSSITVPAGLPHRFLDPSDDCLLLVATIPARSA